MGCALQKCPAKATKLFQAGSKSFSGCFHVTGTWFVRTTLICLSHLHQICECVPTYLLMGHFSMSSEQEASSPCNFLPWSGNCIRLVRVLFQFTAMHLLFSLLLACSCAHSMIPPQKLVLHMPSNMQVDAECVQRQQFAVYKGEHKRPANI